MRRSFKFVILCTLAMSSTWLEAIEIYLVRHGQTDWNVRHIVQGQNDVPLNAEGRKQASKLALYVKALDISKCYSSDLQRSMETADILFKNKSVTIIADARWRERSCGKWEGLPLADYAQASAAEKSDVESVPMILERVHAAMDQLAAEHPDEKIVVVTHGGVMQHLLQDIVKPKKMRIEIRNGCLVQLIKSSEGWKIGKVHGAIIRK